MGEEVGYLLLKKKKKEKERETSVPPRTPSRYPHIQWSAKSELKKGNELPRRDAK